MDRSNSYRSAHGSSGIRGLVLAAALGVAGLTGVAPVQAQEMCGGVNYPFPYTDVSGVGAPFCPGILEAYVTGVSKGTSPTTFSPTDNVSRLQMTTFLQRSLDQGLKRGSRRAALNQWWTPQSNTMQTIPIGFHPQYCASDGESIWTSGAGQVAQVQASTGKVLGAWTGAPGGQGILVAEGKVFVAANTGKLFVLDSTQPPAVVTTAVSSLGGNPVGIAFDGTHLWTANTTGSVSIITPHATTPYPVTTVSTGFSTVTGILYDGANIWVTESIAGGTLLKLDSAGVILQTVSVGPYPQQPVFDGANIWVPTGLSITVVQASTGNVVATISADLTNKLSLPTTASFDGERILVTNQGGDSVTVFKAADLSFIANVPTGTSTGPWGACSDGVNFWVSLSSTTNLLRF